MKYYDQKLNSIDPYGSCNVSSLAMALSALGVNITPDELYRRADQNGWAVGDPQTLVKLAKNLGVVDVFTDKGTFKGIKKALSLGRPLILHGYFTNPGHIIAVKGQNDYGLWVNDPYGEYFANSRSYDTRLSGAGLWYSWGLIARVCSPESENDPKDLWFHQLYKA